MLKTVLVLPDGRTISSGQEGQCAVAALSITQCVNDAQELMPGAVCADMAEITLITYGECPIAPADEVTLYRQDSAGTLHKVGIFTAEKPTRTGANTVKLTAYDRISKLDRDLSQWLAQLQQWPYSLGDFAYRVCQACGLEFITEEMPNGAYPVSQFSLGEVTGRKLMQWVGEISGQFCRATPDGQIEMAWYTPVRSSFYHKGHLTITSRELAIADDGTGNGILTSDTAEITHDGNGNWTVNLALDVQDLYCFQNGMTFEDYTVAPIRKVQLRQSTADIGTVYPDSPGENTCIISGNCLLTGSADELRTAAQTLYEQLENRQYTPCTLTVPANPAITAGTVLCLTDGEGRPFTAYVMTSRQTGQKQILESTGSRYRDSTTAVNNRSYKSFTGKVLNLQTDVDGLKVQNAAANGRMAQLQLDIDGISTQVSRQQETMGQMRQSVSSLQQTAEGISLQVQDIVDKGVSKVTNTLGLKIDGTAVTISRAGNAMTNSLDETGMYVIRGKDTANETVMLQANDGGVIATDVSVRNYLIVGNYCRFEDYNSGTDTARTACFFLGG